MFRTRRIPSRSHVSMGPATVHDAFRLRAAAHPDAVALRTHAGTKTYREIDRTSDSVARRIHARGVGVGHRVGLLMPRTMDFVVTVLGVLKSGAGFVPFDPDATNEAMAWMLADSRPSLVIAADGSVGADLGDERVALGSLLREACARKGAISPVRRNDLACVMYSMAADGRPTGAAVPHHGMLRLVLEGAGKTAIPANFDVNVLEIFATLLNGGTLSLPIPGHASGGSGGQAPVVGTQTAETQTAGTQSAELQSVGAQIGAEETIAVVEHPDIGTYMAQIVANGGHLAEYALAHRLAESLPDWMRPARVFVLASLQDAAEERPGHGKPTDAQQSPDVVVSRTIH